jgi:hypothetical protein
MAITMRRIDGMKTMMVVLTEMLRSMQWVAFRSTKLLVQLLRPYLNLRILIIFKTVDNIPIRRDFAFNTMRVRPSQRLKQQYKPKRDQISWD